MRDCLSSASLRPATAADDAFLLAVYSSTRSGELDAVGWDDNQKRLFIKMQFDAQRRCYPDGDNSVVMVDERAAGRILVSRSDSEILLVDISLLPEYRNAGIGTCLIQKLLREAAVAGKPVRLHVLNSSPAVKLYDRLEFVRIGSDGTYLEMLWTPVATRSC
jgi:ribosomal protein S18 acetylase RimI-like enzyme